MKVRTPKMPIMVQVADILRRARKLPPDRPEMTFGN